MLTGGETGGECIADVHHGEPNSVAIGAAGIGGSAATRTNGRCCELTSDELLMAGKRSGAVVV